MNKEECSRVLDSKMLLLFKSISSCMEYLRAHEKPVAASESFVYMDYMRRKNSTAFYRLANLAEGTTQIHDVCVRRCLCGSFSDLGATLSGRKFGYANTAEPGSKKKQLSPLKCNDCIRLGCQHLSESISVTYLENFAPMNIALLLYCYQPPRQEPVNSTDAPALGLVDIEARICGLKFSQSSKTIVKDFIRYRTIWT